MSLVALASKIEDAQTFVLANSALRLMHGAAQALTQVTTYSIVGCVYPNEIAKMIGIIEFFWGIGIASGPLLAEFLFNRGGF